MQKKPENETENGLKFDASKPDWSLLPLKELEPVIRVLEFGANKYERDNWKTVSNAPQRYFSATLRHLAAYQTGEKNDPETGESHLSHALCCLIFISALTRSDSS